MSDFYEDYFFGQEGGGSCSLCGSSGTTKATCPLNPNAKNPNAEKHPFAVVTKPSKQTKATKQSKVPAKVTKAPAKIAKEVKKDKIVVKSKDEPSLSATFLESSRGAKTNIKPKIDDIEKLDDWLNLKNSIAEYSSMYGQSSQYTKDQYKLITLAEYMNLMERLAEKVYFPNHEQDKNWIGTKPKFGVEYDPIFIQKVRVSEKSKIALIGDLHSSMTSLIHILEALRDTEGYFQDNFTLKKDHYIFFLGDVVDRGPYGIELLSLISLLQINNPNQVFLVNGNHEDYEVYSRYGFADEIQNQFEVEMAQVISLTHFLHHLPSAIYLEIGDSNKYQLCHGAIADMTQQVAILNLLKNNDENKHFIFLDSYQIGGTMKVTDNLKWGDFTLDLGVHYSSRDGYSGAINEFGPDVVDKYLNDLGLTAIFSGHQDISNLTFLSRDGITQNPKFEMDTRYNLFRPANYDNLQLNKEYIYTPGTDFIALNTSASYMSKGGSSLRYDVYLQLYV